MMHSDSQIIEQVLAGDIQQFAEIVHRYEKRIFNLMLRMNMAEMDAVDISQEAFIRAYERLHQFKPEHKFYPWLYAIAYHLVLDWQRKKAVRKEALQVDIENCRELAASSDQSGAYEKHDTGERLAAVMATLPSDQREALLLRYRDDCSIKEIARILQLSESAAKMRIHRAVNALKGRLGHFFKATGDRG